MKAIGLMSGSSLDAIDIAYCEFNKTEKKWSFQMPITESIPMPERWKARLIHLPTQSALVYVKTHTYLGHFLGETLCNFIQKNQLKPDLIASHGHTIFHEPQNLMTAQIGDGAAIAAITGIPTITQLRSSDVALGGQGAPIVPIGDKYLFADHRFCLNLGGIANISVKTADDMVAYDIGGANQILNRLVGPLGIPYDDKGTLARKGQLNTDLFNALNELPFFRQLPPKSLSNQWVQTTLWEKIGTAALSVEDSLHTFCKHLAEQVATAISPYNPTKNDELLITGGGAFNSFLVEQIVEAVPCKVVVPDEKIISFKEALVMAFCGVLRWQQIPNVFSSVTGAKQDSVNGAVFIA